MHPATTERPSRGPWIVLAVAFLVLAGAWTALFVIAGRNPVATVPLATPEAGR